MNNLIRGGDKVVNKYTLKMLRVRANMTQEEVADKLNISPATWSKWENFKSYPDVPEIIKIESLFNISYSDINFLPINTV